jgi:hypothetical protein
MSFYSRIEGEITFTDKDQFLKLCNILEKGFWINSEGYFLDESGHKVTEFPTIFSDKLQIFIPNYYYRNLTNINFFKESSVGHLIGTSTDGCFVGWIQTDQGESHYDLLTWAMEELGQDDEDIPDPNGDFVTYCHWQNVVEDAFFDYAEGCTSFRCTFLQ